ncbi:MAG: TIGR03915 family putative DNA repair protein [Treponema sp.]|nr:TIGR03915 family putative DNA repair protein [Treponema sp.]
MSELFDLPKEVPENVDYNNSRVLREIHRLMGLLRFTPNEDGEFIARCAPDHYILPALKEFFTARFGETAWAIIDEKRGITLRRQKGKQAVIIPMENEPTKNEDTGKNTDEWEDLWKHYHKTINNEDRDNPNLQKQLMPKRYWKYLPEVSE